MYLHLLPLHERWAPSNGEARLKNELDPVDFRFGDRNRAALRPDEANNTWYLHNSERRILNVTAKQIARKKCRTTVDQLLAHLPDIEGSKLDVSTIAERLSDHSFHAAADLDGNPESVLAPVILRQRDRGAQTSPQMKRAFAFSRVWKGALVKNRYPFDVRINAVPGGGRQWNYCEACFVRDLG